MIFCAAYGTVRFPRVYRLAKRQENRRFKPYGKASDTAAQARVLSNRQKHAKAGIKRSGSASEHAAIDKQRQHRIASPVLFHAEMLYVRCEHSRALRAYSQSGNAVCFGQNTVCNRPNYTAPFKKHGYRSALGSFYSKTRVFSPF